MPSKQNVKRLVGEKHFNAWHLVMTTGSVLSLRDAMIMARVHPCLSQVIDHTIDIIATRAMTTTAPFSLRTWITTNMTRHSSKNGFRMTDW